MRQVNDVLSHCSKCLELASRLQKVIRQRDEMAEHKAFLQRSLDRSTSCVIDLHAEIARLRAEKDELEATINTHYFNYAGASR